MKCKPPSTPAESNSTESKATVINKPPGKKLTTSDIGLPTDSK